MLISPAFAQTGGGGQGDMLLSLAPLILIFVVFYFLLIRPQQRRMKDHKTMVENVRRGDTVVTGGGIVGKVTKVREDNTAQVEIADGVRINIVRDTISTVRAKGEPQSQQAQSATQSGGAATGSFTEKAGGFLSRFRR